MTHALYSGGKTETPVHRRVDRHRRKQPWNEQTQDFLRDQGHRPRSCGTGKERCHHPPTQAWCVHESGTVVAPDRQGRAAGGLQFIRAQCPMRGYSDGEQGRHRNQSSAPCDGIDQASGKTSEKKQRVGEFGHPAESWSSSEGSGKRENILHDCSRAFGLTTVRFLACGSE